MNIWKKTWLLLAFIGFGTLSFLNHVQASEAKKQNIIKILELKRKRQAYEHNFFLAP